MYDWGHNDAKNANPLLEQPRTSDCPTRQDFEAMYRSGDALSVIIHHDEARCLPSDLFSRCSLLHSHIVRLTCGGLFDPRLHQSMLGPERTWRPVTFNVQQV
jgi:hypothetical protein